MSEEPAAVDRPSRRRLVVRLLLAVLVIAVVYLWLLPKLVDVSGRTCVVRGVKVEAGAIFSIEESELTSCTR